MKPQLIAVTVIIVAALALGTFYFSGGVNIPTTVKTITGLEIAKSTLSFVESNLKTPSGGYEDYVRYESGGVIRSSEENTPENMVVEAYTDRDLYLIYSTLADATGDQGYAALADAKFNEFYNECRDDNLCDGDMYGAVYNEWRRTGNEGYKSALDSTKSALLIEPEENVSETIFSFGGLLETASGPQDCTVGNIALDVQKAGVEDGLIEKLENFAATLQTQGAIESANTLGVLAPCGNFMMGMYDSTQKDTYKRSAEGILQLISDKHPDLKEFEEDATSNLHSIQDVLGTALLAARLHDSEIEVMQN